MRLSQFPDGDEIAPLLIRNNKDHTEIPLGGYVGRAQDKISRHLLQFLLLPRANLGPNTFMEVSAREKKLLLFLSSLNFTFSKLRTRTLLATAIIETWKMIVFNKNMFVGLTNNL